MREKGFACNALKPRFEGTEENVLSPLKSSEKTVMPQCLFHPKPLQCRHQKG